MHEPRERHPYLLHAARALDQAICASGVKAEWLAHALNIAPATLSMYRSGERPLPAYLVPLVDDTLGGPQVLRTLGAMEGCEVLAPTPPPASATPASALEPLIAKHSGALLASILEARADGAISQAEREVIHPQIERLIRELQAEADQLDPRATTPLRRPA